MPTMHAIACAVALRDGSVTVQSVIETWFGTTAGTSREKCGKQLSTGKYINECVSNGWLTPWVNPESRWQPHWRVTEEGTAALVQHACDQREARHGGERERGGQTQTQVAARSGITQGLISQYERDERRLFCPLRFET